MAVFDYSALDLDRTAVAGTVIADSPRQARDMLRGRGLTVLAVRGLRAGRQGGWLERRRGRRAQQDVLAFIGELATLLGAGIPLLAAMDTAIRQHRGRFKAVIQELRDQVAGGKGLAEAMAGRPAYFDQLCVSIVQVGETTGTLEAALGRLEQFKEKAARLRSRVASALVYPAVVCVVGLAVMVFLMTYVVPNLLATLVQAGRPLPAATAIVKAASDLLTGWWWAVLLGGGGLVLAVNAVLGTAAGRLAADRLILRVPVLGELVRKENTSRMAVVMAALLRSGLQFTDAVAITQRTLRSGVFRRALEDYKAAVTAGRDIAGPLEAAGVFAPLVVQVLAVGQQSGELEPMLERLAESYDQQVATAAQRLTALLEPALIVLLAVMVGFIAFATILPILEAANVW